jgi:hypothetical protein
MEPTFDREQEIAARERRLSARHPVGVSAPVAAVAMVLGVLALWIFQRQDLQYFFSPAEPVVLGREGEYRFDLLESNRYVQVHGIPTGRGLYAPEKDGTRVIVGLRDTPILVRRRALPGEEWEPGKGKPPQPDQRPFAAAGRLLAVGDAPGYAAEAARTLSQGDEVRPRDGKMWILLMGERPRQDRGLVAISLALVAFVLLNAWFLAQSVRHRLAR